MVEKLGEHAKARRIVDFRRSFSVEATEKLKRQWREDGLNEAEGWVDLMVGYLGRDGEPPEVVGEEEKSDEVVVVKVAKEIESRGMRIVQDLTLIKEEGDWRLALGEMVFVEEEIEKEGDDEGKEEKEKPDEPEEWDPFGAEDKEKLEKKGREDLEDFDLDEF